MILRERSEQLKRLAEAATSINAAIDIPSVLGVITDEARSLIACHLSVTTLTGDHRLAQVAGRTSPVAQRLRPVEGLRVQGGRGGRERRSHPVEPAGAINAG